MLVVHPASSMALCDPAGSVALCDLAGSLALYDTMILLDHWHCVILLDHWHCVTLLGHCLENSCFEMLTISAGKVQNSKASPGWIFSKDCFFLVLYQYSIYISYLTNTHTQTKHMFLVGL